MDQVENTAFAIRDDLKSHIAFVTARVVSVQIISTPSAMIWMS